MLRRKNTGGHRAVSRGPCLDRAQEIMSMLRLEYKGQLAGRVRDQEQVVVLEALE